MNDKITIEPLAEFSSMGVVREILSQKYIALVAVGSMACISSIQYTAELIGAADRLLVQGLTAREYSLGKNADIIAGLINNAQEFPNIKGIIVYCSCLDVITCLDEEQILAEADVSGGVPVEFLYRGPLVKRKLLPREALQRIWRKWNIQREALLECCYPDHGDVLPVDFKEVINSCQKDTDILLLSPGGCASCLYDLLAPKHSKVFTTRFNDLFLLDCRIDCFVEAIEACFCKTKHLLLLGTAIVKATGISLEEICKQLNKDGYQASYIDTDGFKK